MPIPTQKNNQANRQSINITFAQPRRRGPSRMQKLGKELAAAAEALDVVKDDLHSLGHPFQPEISDIQPTSVEATQKLITEVRQATAQGKRLATMLRQPQEQPQVEPRMQRQGLFPRPYRGPALPPAVVDDRAAYMDPRLAAERFAPAAVPQFLGPIAAAEPAAADEFFDAAEPAAAAADEFFDAAEPAAAAADEFFDAAEPMAAADEFFDAAEPMAAAAGGFFDAEEPAGFFEEPMGDGFFDAGAGEMAPQLLAAESAESQAEQQAPPLTAQVGAESVPEDTTQEDELAAMTAVARLYGSLAPPELVASSEAADSVEDTSEADELAAMTTASGYLGGELARSEAELEEARGHVRELLQMAQDTVGRLGSALPDDLVPGAGIPESMPESLDAERSLEEAQARVRELVQIASELGSGQPPPLTESSSEESSPVVPDEETAAMVAEMRELERMVTQMAGMVESGRDYESGAMGEAPLAEAPTGVLSYGTEVFTLPNVAASSSSEDYKEDAREFLIIRRQVLRGIRNDEMNAGERQIMRASLENYRRAIATQMSGSNTTSKGHLRRLDTNVANTIRNLAG
jgi:hypothetical protein